MSYLSKLVECVVAAQIVKHLQEHAITKPFQSAYRKSHSTETALTYVTNNILSSLDKRNSVFLVFNNMQLSLNSAACLTLGIKKFEHITPSLRKLHWLLIEQCIMFKILCLTFKALNGLAPGYIADLITLYSPPQGHSTLRTNSYCVFPRSAHHRYPAVDINFCLMSNRSHVGETVVSKIHKATFST